MRPAHESHVFQASVAGECLDAVRQGDDDLDQLGVFPACLEAASDRVDENERRPSDVFGGLDDDAVARSEGSDDRRDQVVWWTRHAVSWS